MRRDTTLANICRRRANFHHVVARRRWHERLLTAEHVLVRELALRQRLAITALVNLRHSHIHQIARREVVPLLMGRLTASSLRTLPVSPPLGRRAAVGAFTVPPGTVRSSA